MGVSVGEAKALVAELCQQFYQQGWVSGTGGGLSIKAGDKIVMAPSGVQKERMRPEDMFVLDSAGNVLETPEARPAPYKPPKLSECSPLFMSAYELRNAGAVIHSHSISTVLATILDPEASEFSVTHLEMIKGIEGHGFYGNCVVPIIENTARECELTDRLRAAMQAYPQSNAVLVRRHGVYIWGKDWIQAKTQAECYDYLFQAAVKMHQLGLDPSRPPGPAAMPAATNGHSNGVHVDKKRKLGRKVPAAVVLDIEGTVAPISFVAETLFPYALKHVAGHLESTFDTAETQADVALIRQQAAEDVAQGVAGAAAIPEASAGQAAVCAAVVAWVQGAVAADRKVGALKELQGHIWEGGFKKGELKADLFRDVPDALTEWRAAGVKTYIYSSGSRFAQRLLFKYTTAGDLRPYLAGFFDTTSGIKVEAPSYRNIALSLGVDSAADVLFATDSLPEAQAAKEAGWNAVLVERPGNKPLPAGHGCRVITSMQQLLE